MFGFQVFHFSNFFSVSIRDAIFFYINLGLSRRKMLTSVILIDFLALVVLMTIVPDLSYLEKFLRNLVLDSKSKICTLSCTLEELAVLRFLKADPKATQRQIANHLGRSERTIKSMTVRLTEKEYLIRKNGKRDGWWEVLVELPLLP